MEVASDSPRRDHRHCITDHSRHRILELDRMSPNTIGTKKRIDGHVCYLRAVRGDKREWWDSTAKRVIYTTGPIPRRSRREAVREWESLASSQGIGHQVREQIIRLSEQCGLPLNVVQRTITGE